MKTDFHVIIPARYQSLRLPGKLLMDIDGITVLERVYRQAIQAKPQSITIATDSHTIMEQAHAFGATAMMTSAEHTSGTDRIAEVVEKQGFSKEDIVVNVQGDEPFIAPELIAQVAHSLASSTAPMATLCWPVASVDELANANVVKVVRDKDDYALYFSRAMIPAHRDSTGSIEHAFRHIGLYAYRAMFLKIITELPMCAIEQAEALEQLRVLWAGHKIKVDTACVAPQQDINTASDLTQARLFAIDARRTQ